MRKWLLTAVLGLAFMFPSFSSAQTNISLSNVSVQLWPEYDQPSMLVIVDFDVTTDTQLPAKITFGIPQEANLIAVAAYQANGDLVNAMFDGPNDNSGVQFFTISLNVGSSYRFEYYQPIMFNGNQRTFLYTWDGVYAVNSFNIRVLEPVDTLSLKSSPELSSIRQDNGLKFHEAKPAKLAKGQSFTLNLDYEKRTNTLVSPPDGVQPSAPVDENTPGRVSLNNSLLYIIGGLGLIMIVGGIVYYLQSNRPETRKVRRRTSSSPENEHRTGIYCSQCGARAKVGDRFCRVCGARLRHQEE